MKFVLHIIAVAVALFIAELAVPGIQLTGSNAGTKIGTLIVVAIIFGIINAILKPLIRSLGCALYLLTFGLIGLVVNGLLLWLASYVTGKLTLPFHITGFWPAFWGAIIVGIVSWLVGMVLDRGAKAVRAIR